LAPAPEAQESVLARYRLTRFAEAVIVSRPDGKLRYIVVEPPRTAEVVQLYRKAYERILASPSTLKLFRSCESVEDAYTKALEYVRSIAEEELSGDIPGQILR